MRVGKAKTAAYPLPPLVLGLLEEGYELGQADDLCFGTVDSKRSTGAVGILTGDLITRTELYASAAVLALIPFKNPDWY
jgi:non-canonical (house-cleaning) NTP pyrophosphatase